MNYILFGAGVTGKKALYFLNYQRVECFVKNGAQQDEIIEGKKVIPYSRMIHMNLTDYIIVIASEKYYMEMEEQLKRDGIKNYFIFQTNIWKEFYKNIPFYWIYRTQEWLTYVRLLSHYDIKTLKSAAVYGENEMLPYLISELLFQNPKLNIVEIISEKKTAKNCLGIPIVDLNQSNGMYECLIVNKRRNDQNTGFLESIVDKRIIDIYDIDCLEPRFEYKNLEMYRNLHKGKRCFIVGTGPSLTMEDLDTLYAHGEICLSVNKIYRCYGYTKWRANYVGATDPLVVADIIKDMEEGMELPQNLFIGDNNIHCEKNVIIENAQYFHLRVEDPVPNRPRFSSDITKGTYRGGTVTYDFGIQMAAYMGFSEIYLLGIDHEMRGNVGDDDSHFIKEYTHQNEKEKYNFKSGAFELATSAYEAAKIYSEKNGFRIYNATRGGSLNVFQRVNFDRLFIENREENPNI